MQDALEIQSLQFTSEILIWFSLRKRDAVGDGNLVATKTFPEPTLS